MGLRGHLPWKLSVLEFGFWASKSKSLGNGTKAIRFLVPKAPFYVIEMGFSVFLKYEIIKGGMRGMAETNSCFSFPLPW